VLVRKFHKAHKIDDSKKNQWEGKSSIKTYVQAGRLYGLNEEKKGNFLYV